MKIVIADGLATSALELLNRENWTVDVRSGQQPNELATNLADADALIVRGATTVDSNLIAAGRQLRVIARAGTGIDNVDLDNATKRGILVLNAPGMNSVSVAEHTCALMLGLARSVSRADAAMKQGHWEKKNLIGAELHGKTLGIVGLGRIGREVAGRALAFGMKVLAHDPFISEQRASDLAVELLLLDNLCAESDFITLHLPSNSATCALFDKTRFSRCKFGVRIINTARGNLIDENALVEAIRSGQVAGAGLDVFQAEPPTNSSLTSLPQVIATPHIGASTQEAQELVGLETAASVRDFLKSGIVRNAVNFPSIPPDEFKRLQPFITMAERLGDLLGQLSDGRPEAIGIRYYGDLVGANSELLVGSTLAGLFKGVLSSTVTPINARSIAVQRGIEVIESSSSRHRKFTSLLSVKLRTSKDERWVEGTVFDYGRPRLVLLDGVEIETPLEGLLIVIQNNDQPGVIGEVGTILGHYSINIATFVLGRNPTGAVGVVSIDQRVPGTLPNDSTINKDLLADIRAIEAVKKAELVRL